MAEFESDAWTAYWTSGALHSCADGFAANYGGAIAGFWRSTVAALPVEANRILDLATGNGAIPRLIADCFPERAFSIDAVDRARLQPPERGPAGRVTLRLHGGVAIEALPFGERSFDLVCSQFGLEYAAREPSLAQVARVAAQGARLAWIAHHPDSAIARVSRSELAVFEALLDDAGLIAAALAALPWIVRARRGEDLRGDVAAESARSAYNRAQQRLDRLAQRQASATLDDARRQVQWILGGRAGNDAPAQEALLQRYRQALVFGRERTRQMLAAALDADAVANVVATLGRLRRLDQVTTTPFDDGDLCVGWRIEARFAD